MAAHYQQYATAPQPEETYEIAAEWLISQLSGNILAKHDAFKVAVHQANREVGQEAGRKFTLTLFTQAEDYPKNRPTLNIPVTGIIKGRLMGLAREKGSHVNFTGLKKNITAWIAESEGWIEDGAETPPSSASSSSSSSGHGSHSRSHSLSHPGSHHQSRGASQVHSDTVPPQHGSHHGSLRHSQHSSHPGSEHGSRRSSISHPQPPSRAGSEYGSPSTSQAGPEDSSSTAKRRRSSSTSNKMGGFFGDKKPKEK